MTTFTLHLPRDARPGDPAALEKADLVKDAFSWGAFFFTFLWFFVHRLWLAGLCVLFALVAFNMMLNLLNVHPTASLVAHVLFSALIGLEANSLRRWTLARHGRPTADVVSAADRDEAETKIAARWLERSAAPAPAPARAAAPSPAPRVYPSPRTEPVIGLFPDAERPR
ncbi:DUF2628 domain-containing protein [Microvirga lenta]|uniref:DUF2628 domain-containing protein n=1 Tax=Microvirga lenta TaxID=2881337 RepID=UPI001CFFEE86|nr:DUF2628 domain-containing protein [Microvirga lenta]MCB5174757.1 DUF2628 domain-containing protein [Microvirga lenta]